MLENKDIERITQLSSEKGWVPPEWALRIAGDVGVDKVIEILLAQPRKIVWRKCLEI